MHLVQQHLNARQIVDYRISEQLVIQLPNQLPNAFYDLPVYRHYT
ncbi:MAG: hypothetical protein ACI85E_002190, partial [Marinomonas primoryensis]